MKLLLKIFIGLGLLVVLAIVAVALSPQGRALFGMARTLAAAASSPTAQELRRHGCETALVAPLGELMAALGKIVDLTGDEAAAQVVAANPTIVFCAAPAGTAPPDCAALARTYGSFDKTAPPEFGVYVQAGDAKACSGYYAATGQKIAEFDPEPALEQR